MDAVELRPLSLGEILDRTFTLYRRHFLFFVTLAGIFQIPSLIFAVWQAQYLTDPQFSFTRIGITVVAYLILLIGNLLASAGATLAISEFYLGHTITISEAVERVVGRLGALLGALLIALAAIGLGTIFLFIPGIYVACRLMVNTPAVVIDKKGPGGAFSRSWALTQGFAGRAFLIYLLYGVLAIAVAAVTTLPATYMITRSVGNPDALRLWATVQAIASTVTSTVLAPIIQISVGVFYYDLRVRKEAFDIHFMMNPDAPADDPRFIAEA
jgi:hypothetical protein